MDHFDKITNDSHRLLYQHICLTPNAQYIKKAINNFHYKTFLSPNKQKCKNMIKWWCQFTKHIYENFTGFLKLGIFSHIHFLSLLRIPFSVRLATLSRGDYCSLEWGGNYTIIHCQEDLRFELLFELLCLSLPLSIKCKFYSKGNNTKKT